MREDGIEDEGEKGILGKTKTHFFCRYRMFTFILSHFCLRLKRRIRSAQNRSPECHLTSPRFLQE